VFGVFGHRPDVLCPLGVDRATSSRTRHHDSTAHQARMSDCRLERDKGSQRKPQDVKLAAPLSTLPDSNVVRHELWL